MADIVKTVGYFAHWKVNIKHGVQISDSFKIAMWRWKIKISCSEGVTAITLYPEQYQYKFGDDRLNPPVASFQMRILNFVGKQSQILDQSEEIRNWLFDLNRPFECTTDTELPEAYCLEVEFSELRSSNTYNCREKFFSGHPIFYFDGYKRRKSSPPPGPLPQENILTTINTLGGSMTAYWHVLCSRSSVFKEMLKDPNDTVTMDMPSLESRIFINHLQNRRADGALWQYAKKLLEAAKKYEVPDLTKDIEKRLTRDITTKNVVERLKIAYDYQLENLRAQCIRLLVEFGKIHEIENDFGDFITSIDKDLLCKTFYDCIL